MLALSLSLLSLSASTSAKVVAKGCGGHDLHFPVGRDHIHGKRQYVAPTDVASASQSVDPTEQCTAYNYQPIIDLKASFPTIWETATLVSGDSEAAALFAQINKTVAEKVPNVQIKPTTTTGYNYDRSDPDCWWTWQGCTTPSSALGLESDIIRIPEPNSIGLTVDDGPNCSQNAFYNYLRETGQKGSMYLIGSNVFVWPLQAMRIHQDGHEVAVHTWSHQPMTSLTNEQAFAELYYTRKIIKDIIGVTPKTWRPPQGDVDNRIRVIAQGLNLTNILWTDDIDDWRAQAPGSTVTTQDVDNNYQKVVDQGKNGNLSTQGAILLAHQSTNYTMSTLMKWLPQLRAAITHVVPIAAGMNWTQPYVELDQTYQNFDQYIANQSASSPPVTTVTGSSTTFTSAVPTGSSSSSSSSSGSSAAASSGSAGKKMESAFTLGMGVVVGMVGVGVSIGLGLVL